MCTLRMVPPKDNCSTPTLDINSFAGSDHDPKRPQCGAREQEHDEALVSDESPTSRTDERLPIYAVAAAMPKSAVMQRRRIVDREVIRAKSCSDLTNIDDALAAERLSSDDERQSFRQDSMLLESRRSLLRQSYQQPTAPFGRPPPRHSRPCRFFACFEAH